MTKKDYYQVLGVYRGADQAAIKRAYRRLAMKYHPDQNPDNSDAISRMKEINEAYAVLGDPQKRRAYDVRGTAKRQGVVVEDLFRSADFGSLFWDFDLDSIFGESLFDTFFGHGRGIRTKQASKGADRAYEMGISAAEALSGTEKRIEVYRLEKCPTCQGSGANYAGLVECERCLGSGQLMYEKSCGFGLFRQFTPCPVCGGRGKMIIDPCDHCLGRGVMEKLEKLTVAVPPHVEDGDAIKVPRRGDAGKSGAEPGDLYLILHVK